MVCLLDLPDDLLGALLCRRLLSPKTLVEIACASKAAAAVALPQLYSDLLVPSIAALPLLHATLQARPDLAQHVRSVTAGRYFVLADQFRKHEASVQQCRLLPDSPIVSMTKAIQRYGLNTLNCLLPMPWLVKIATICPGLTTVDLSAMYDIGVENTCVMLGLVDLANVLRARQGRFVCRNWPYSCVLVKDHVITPKSQLEGSVVFAADLLDQDMWVVSRWLKSKGTLRLKGGLVIGEDRCFDLSQPPLGQGHHYSVCSHAGQAQRLCALYSR